MALIHMNGTELEHALSQNPFTLVCFWAEWQEDCKEARKALEAVSELCAPKTAFVAVNADEEGFLALELGIYSLPGVLLFRGEEEIDRLFGAQDAQLYESFVRSHTQPEDIDPYELIQSSGYMG